MGGITEKTIRLSNGVLMPQLGLGTYKMTGEECKIAVPTAISIGYCLIDTATIYRNEEAIGSVIHDLIQNKVVRRNELFLESKLSTFDHGYEETIKAVDASLRKLQVDYVDLYIIHWPGASKLDVSSPRNAELRRDSWRALEDLYKAGKIRAIGVSNYLVRHLEEMKSYASIMPMVNQFELHPLYYPVELVDYCRKHNIIVQAYSSLARGVLLEPGELLKHPVLPMATKRTGKTISQILLRWAWQHDFAIIPKSVNEQRIRENADIDFELTEEEMNLIDQIHANDGRKICWDPETVM